MDINVIAANASHTKYTDQLCKMMEEAAQKRGTGIAKRSPDYLKNKMEEGKAIIALDGDKAIGFSYIESWQDEKYVANSGLIVHPDYRGMGLAKKIKHSIFALSKEKFPDSKIFSITTSAVVMKMNSDLGYKPVIFSELTSDEKFWKGCQSCTNFEILQSKDYKNCLCTGMLYKPEWEKENTIKHTPAAKLGRWKRLKAFLKKNNPFK